MTSPVERFLVRLPGERDPLDSQRHRPPRLRQSAPAFYLAAAVLPGATILLSWPRAEAVTLLGPSSGAIVLAGTIGMLLAILPGHHGGRALIACLAVAATFLGTLPDTLGVMTPAAMLAEVRARTAYLLLALADGSVAGDDTVASADVAFGLVPARVRIDPEVARTEVSLVDLARAGLEVDLAGRVLIPRLTVEGRILTNVEAGLLPDAEEPSVLGHDVLDRRAADVAPAAASH